MIRKYALGLTNSHSWLGCFSLAWAAVSSSRSHSSLQQAADPDAAAEFREHVRQFAQKVNELCNGLQWTTSTGHPLKP